jgi:hypothetical protein
MPSELARAAFLWGGCRPRKDNSGADHHGWTDWYREGTGRQGATDGSARRRPDLKIQPIGVGKFGRLVACLRLYTLALFVVIGLVFYLAIGEIRMPDVVKSTLDTLLGVLITMVIGSKEYFFGSSSRADKQTALITQFAVSLDITVSTGSARGATADYSKNNFGCATEGVP